MTNSVILVGMRFFFLCMSNYLFMYNLRPSIPLFYLINICRGNLEISQAMKGVMFIFWYLKLQGQAKGSVPVIL